MKNQKKKSFFRRAFLCLLAVLLAVYVAFGVYVNDYYHADLTDSGLRVYSTYGSEDGVLNREKYEADRTNLPQDTTETVIDGGCHAGFGSYGAQKGDGTPTNLCRGTTAADGGRAGGMDESSIKSKNIPTIFLQITGEWPGLSFVFRKSGINTNEIYG